MNLKKILEFRSKKLVYLVDGCEDGGEAVKTASVLQPHVFGMPFYLHGRAIIASRCLSSFAAARVFAASLSSIPLKGSYTAITEQLWGQRELAKLRCTSVPTSASDKSTSIVPKPQTDTVVAYNFPLDARLKDEYGNPWGDVR